MSVENSPNLNAVGFMTAILDALKHHIRGNAAKADYGKVLVLFIDDIKKFTAQTDAALDQYFGTEPK